jgi:sigma-B regulation protein RsbU (phosphoserine phosphatase)
MPTPDSQTMTCMEVWGGNALTDNAVSMSGLDAWVYSKPYAKAQAGGDVYYVSSCATGRITRLLVADVSGHGAAVTDTASTLRTLMRRYVNHLDQNVFVQSMNREFARLSSVGTFATAVVMTFFGPTRYVTLCNAGHPTPLLYRAKTKSWLLLEQRDADTAPTDDIANIPLGIDDVASYQQIAFELDVGDLVLCYSDSLIESHAPNGELLGEQGLLDVARTIPVTDPAAITPTLLERLRALHPDNLEEDDVTILLFRASGAAGQRNFFQRALAPIRVAGASLVALFTGRGPGPLPDFSAANILGAIIPAFNRRVSRRNPR